MKLTNSLKMFVIIDVKLFSNLKLSNMWLSYTVFISEATTLHKPKHISHKSTPNVKYNNQNVLTNVYYHYIYIQ